MDQKFGVKYNFEFISYNKETGKINKKSKAHNLVVNSGLDAVVDLIVTEFDYLAIGMGTTAVVAGDVALEDELMREAVTATTVSTGVRKYDKTFTVGSGVSEIIKEAGLFNSATASGSTMLNRVVSVDPFTIDIDNPLRVIATITVANS